ncbi:hypothetical protein C8034_v001440 [Colletotrichum sidae]|uniref:Uncharacterized protein n=1 Tax=Colletotrichum sidae TaxID=1347389 RepID=A0A4V3I2U9_9PEZI|nr:hypothetical protein C8034_v001440 [Colletotrichum sidae]
MASELRHQEQDGPACLDTLNTLPWCGDVKASDTDATSRTSVSVNFFPMTSAVQLASLPWPSLADQPFHQLFESINHGGEKGQGSRRRTWLLGRSRTTLTRLAEIANHIVKTKRRSRPFPLGCSFVQADVHYHPWQIHPT